MHQIHSQAGFSLIELLVSMTIFSIVVTMSTGTLLVLLDANSKAQNMQTIMNDLTIGIDSMTREIRTGYNYVCGSAGSAPSGVESESDTQNCAGGNYISVVESGDSLTAGLSNGRVSYYYDQDLEAIFRRLGDEDWIQLTARNIRITDAEFIVTGTDTGTVDGAQPSVTIYLAGEAGALAEVDDDFELQTSVSQRPIDL